MEINKTKYEFDILTKTILGKLHLAKTKFHTKIEIMNNNLSYSLTREVLGNSNDGERKYNSFTEGEENICIDDIESIKYKTGISFALNFYDIFLFFIIIAYIFNFIVEQKGIWNNVTNELEQYLLNYNYNLAFVCFFTMFLSVKYFICKCIEIKYRENGKIRKIVFPISGNLSFTKDKIINQNVDELLSKLLNELSQRKAELEIKKDKSKLIYIILTIIIFYVYFFQQLYLI